MRDNRSEYRSSIVSLNEGQREFFLYQAWRSARRISITKPGLTM